MPELLLTLRRLRRTPRTTVLALATLATGMSVALVAFGLLANAFLRPPPGIDANRPLMRVLVAQETAEASAWHTSAIVSLDQFATIEKAVQGVLDVAAYSPEQVTLASGRVIDALVVTPRYFAILGVRSASGTLVPSMEVGGRTGLVLSGRLMQALSLAAAPEALTVNGVPVPVLGVADPAFGGIEPPSADLFVFTTAARQIPELSQLVENRTLTSSSVIALRRSGVPDERVSVALTRARTALEHAESRAGVTYRVYRSSLLSPRSGTARPLMEQLPAILLALAAVVLGIAIANLGGLQVSQAIERRRDLAVRIALGARIGDLFKLQLTESLVIAVSAAGLSAAGVWLLHPLLARLVPTLHANPVDWRLVAVTVGITTLSTIAVAVMPVLYAQRQLRRPELSESAYATSSGRWHRGLLGIQAALAIVLVVTAATLLASVRAVQAIPLGFDPVGLHVGTLELLRSGSGAGANGSGLSSFALLDLRDSVRRLPGVIGASVAIGAPARRLHSLPVARREVVLDPAGPQMIGAIMNQVDEAFFETAGLAIRRGRAFRETDQQAGITLAIMSQSLAQTLFGTADPLESCLVVATLGETCTRIIGVAEDAKYLSVTDEPPPVIYFPLGPRSPLEGAVLYVRTRPDRPVPVSAILTRMREADARPMRTLLEPLSAILAPQTARFRLAATAATLLSIAGLVMLATGLTAHLRVVFAARRREIGVRLALGARPRHIGRFVARDLVVGMAIGALTGMLLAAAAVRYVRPVLFGVTGTTIEAYTAGIVALLVVTGLAVGLPTLRVTKVPPLTTLR